MTSKSIWTILSSPLCFSWAKLKGAATGEHFAHLALILFVLLVLILGEDALDEGVLFFLALLEGSHIEALLEGLCHLLALGNEEIKKFGSLRIVGLADLLDVIHLHLGHVSWIELAEVLCKRTRGHNESDKR